MNNDKIWELWNRPDHLWINDVKPVEHSGKECAGRLLGVTAIISSDVVELVEARTVVEPI